jgi:L-lactate dehydrogenase complex protein LldG
MDALLDALFGADRDHVMIVHGRFAVAENAAVYVDAADLAQRDDIVREEQMVVIVSADAVVPTMHEALRLMPAGAGCGWFLSGPSKTADIEQSLVFGAQGSRTHHVILDAG